ncbi:MAG: hypothetical protein ACC628_07185, partial [Pirellulaceae bacterium]
MNTGEVTEVASCPDCQAPLPTIARFCWLCGRNFTSKVAPEPQAIVHPHAAHQFSLATLMLVMTFVSVLVGVFTFSVGIGLTLLFLAGPALVRTCVVAARRKVRGKRLTPAGKVGVLFARLGIVVTGVRATIAAFFA